MEKAAIYDTSSLINAYKQRKRLTGYTTIFNIVEFPKILDFKLTVLYPSKSDYNLAIKLSKDVLRIGNRCPQLIFVAAMALNRNMKLVTSDKHFAVIREIRQDFKLYIE